MRMSQKRQTFGKNVSYDNNNRIEEKNGENK